MPCAAGSKLILDVLTGDQTLFVRADEVEASWAVFEPVLRDERDISPYPMGSWGPEESNRLLGRRGHRWFSA